VKRHPAGWNGVVVRCGGMNLSLPSPRSRWLSGLLVLVTIALGLASRRWPGLFPAVLGKYPGDALWAQMVYWLGALVAPAATVRRLALVALGIAWAVEFSQLWHPPWLDAIRATTPGHLVLGSAFGGIDLLAYAVGIVIVAGIDAALRSRCRG
jgi:hypothetical protein